MHSLLLMLAIGLANGAEAATALSVSTGPVGPLGLSAPSQRDTPPASTARVRIEGRVVDARGQPVAKARVFLAEVVRASIFCTSPEQVYAIAPGELPKDPHPEGVSTAEVVTDADGGFRAGELRAGTYNALAVEAQRGIGWIVNTERVDAPFVITLQPTITLAGALAGLKFDGSRHLIELKPVTAVTNISFLPRVQFLDGDRFSIGPLPAILDWNLLCTDWSLERGYRATVFQVPVRLVAGKKNDVRIDLAAGVEVSGDVHGPTGEPLSAVSVVLRGPGELTGELGALTDERGHYIVRGLVPGEYALEARRWTLRQTAGCGFGPKDVAYSRSVRVPFTEPKQGDVGVTAFCDALAVGQPAPTFRVPMLDGTTLDLADLKGKIVLLDFWATWCAMCRAGLHDLVETEKVYGSPGDLVVVGVSFDDEPATVRRFVDTLKIRWRQTSLGPAEKNSIARLYNISATPTCILIGRDGRIAARDVFGAELREQVKRLMSVPLRANDAK